MPHFQLEQKHQECGLQLARAAMRHFHGEPVHAVHALLWGFVELCMRTAANPREAIDNGIAMLAQSDPAQGSELAAMVMRAVEATIAKGAS